MIEIFLEPEKNLLTSLDHPTNGESRAMRVGYFKVNVDLQSLQIGARFSHIQASSVDHNVSVTLRMQENGFDIPFSKWFLKYI